VASWNNEASLNPRIAAYQKAADECKNMATILKNPKIPSSLSNITMIGENNATVKILELLSNELMAMITGGKNMIKPAERNLDKFFVKRAENGSLRIVVDDDKDTGTSGRLYEAYFGFVPDGNGYSQTRYTYPME
jgi:hypothetical protein